MTSYADPSGGVAVNGATCTHSGGITTMTYTRTAAAAVEQLGISLVEGQSTNLIWAYGSSTTKGYHAARGSVAVDVMGDATPASGECCKIRTLLIGSVLVGVVFCSHIGNHFPPTPPSH
jgi:hypothetical protein